MITAGTRLGPYEIVAPLGAGGMGEVYRARDTRLGRDVAVKVLPASLIASAEVRARFEREARTISGLNHPNICTLFDVGREGETEYLVMELIEGETLAQRLTRGALPGADVLRIGAQIADALDRAHRAGVVHRDLKPGNVMLTKSGAKLMDFGLARATGMAPASGSSGAGAAVLTQTPTMAQPLTAEGTIVGTFQYMSPEQLEGGEADARSDLWALGCVLYEMATGKAAFHGRSQASLIGAIMHSEPTPVSQVAPMSPPALDRLVSACLAKDPADRVQSAHDIKLQLVWMSDGAISASSVGAPAIPAARRRPAWIPFATVAIAAVGITALVMSLIGGRDKPPSGGAERYTLGSAELELQSEPTLSPDGSWVVFSVREGGSRRLYRRNLSSLEITPIAGTEDGRSPFFSPDGAWLGFATGEALKKVPADGGVAQLIVAEPRIDGAAWARDGQIYFCARSGGSDASTALARVPAGGGPIQRVAALDTTKHDIEAWLPEVLPDGKTVVITVFGSGGGWRSEVVRPDGARHPLIVDGILPRYRQGHLIYYDLESQVILAVPFDASNAKITGPALPLTEQADGNFCFDVSKDGKLVYVARQGAGAGEQIVWLDRTGKSTPAFDTRSTWAQPRMSPDGKNILVRKELTKCELWVFDTERRSLNRVAQSTDNHNGIWSGDGRRVACEHFDVGSEMVAFTLNGAREMTKVANGAVHGGPRSWSAGGNLLAYTTTGRTTRSDIWVAPMDPGGPPPAPFLASEFEETEPAISPDGQWIAYVTNESGGTQVMVRRYPDAGTVWQVSVDGGTNPVWSRDGRELFFALGSKMMVALVQTKPAFHAGTPQELFDGGFKVSRNRDWDVSPDGRFVAIGRAMGVGAANEIRLLVNWPAAMQRVSAPRH